jgi:hypothetical protein
MNSFLPLLRQHEYSSVAWRESQLRPGVRYAIRKPSLAQRIELMRRIRELMQKHEFLKAGNSAEQIEARLSELLADKLYVEWGLAEIQGLRIDGAPADPQMILEKGPEDLLDEIVRAIQAESGLSEDERKNS